MVSYTFTVSHYELSLWLPLHSAGMTKSWSWFWILKELPFLQLCPSLLLSFKKGCNKKQPEMRGRLSASCEGQNEHERERKKEKVLKNMPTPDRQKEWEWNKDTEIKLDICSGLLQVIWRWRVSSWFPCQGDSAKLGEIKGWWHVHIHL